MTGRERLSACARGGEVDRKAVLRWPTGLMPGGLVDGLSDGLVASSLDLAREAMEGQPDSAVLLTVLSPLGWELKEPQGLLKLLHDDPQEGEKILEKRIHQTKEAISRALEAGADGIVYILAGASPDTTTPMQYGGHFLEVDRDLLSSVEEARFNLLWIRGKEEPYLDFIIDLPAHALAWDMQGTGIPPSAFRNARGGPIAGLHPDADIYLVDRFDQASPWIAEEMESRGREPHEVLN